MMKPLRPGANAALSVLKFKLWIRNQKIPGLEMDVSAFLLKSDGNAIGDRGMCFYGQTSVENGAVVLQESGDVEGKSFEIDLSKVGPAIDKIAFVMTIHEGRGTFDSLPEIRIEVPENGPLLGDIPCADMSETALILAEVYRRESQWKFRVVGQGFTGGLSALAQHFGVEVMAQDLQPASPASDGAAAKTPVNLSKISLTKRGESSRISLKKDDGIIRVTATWIDNGDNRSDNDDLDLRAGILTPDGAMYWLAASHPGSLQAHPFARHLGDVTSASSDAPGREIIEINRDISKRMEGAVGLVFSVYSAISNGPVSIASLKPVMTIEHGGDVVECKYNFADGRAAKGVYTYVIGTLLIDDDDVSVVLSGLTSNPGSEATPWISLDHSNLIVTFDGTPVFKKGRTLSSRLLGIGSKKYANV